MNEWKNPSERFHNGTYERRKTVRGVTITASSKESAHTASTLYNEKVAAHLAQVRSNARILATDYLDRWLQDVKETRSANTYTTYERAIRLYVADALRGKRLADVSVADIADIQRDMRQRKLSGNTISVTRAALGVAFGAAEREGLIGRNVVRLSQAIPVQIAEVTPLTPQEAAQFLQTARTHRYYPMFLLAFTTGMRRGELCGLRWRDINLSQHVINLRTQLQKVEGIWQPVRLKGKQRVRTIDIPPVAVAALEEARKSAIDNPYGLAFTRANGLPVSGSVLNWLAKDLMRKAGIPPRRFHTLRHSCASLLASMGHTPHEIQRLLGHATPTITNNIYTHLFPSEVSRTAATMEAFMGKVMGTTETTTDSSLHGKGNATDVQ